MTFTLARKLPSEAAMMAVMAAVLTAPLGAAAQTTEVKGMISAREGHHLEITAPDGTKTELNLTDATKVTVVSGALKLQRSDGSISDLIAGLPVDIDAQPNGSALDAVKVTYKAGDMKTARQVEAGTAQAKARVRAKAAELQAQNDELKRRMSEANQYDEKAQATVLFATGSSAVSAQARNDLQGIAAKAKGIKGYLVSVIGYADPTGNPTANQRLSERRAAAVIAYLQKSCGLQPQRVLAGDAMGDAHQVGDASSPEGRVQNRRVVVKVLTNKGLEGL
jgi:outer membrane protein OmpA-like peptidoglycan-associated protein